MTERQPNDLYDALRDRLAGYGQEPPAPLWAAIRAQLPPVAQPRLRRRRWAPAALVVLLLAVASGTGWHWWRNTATVGRSSTSSPQNAAQAKGPATTNGITATRPLTVPPTAATARRPKLGSGRNINDSLSINTYESRSYFTKDNFANAATPNVTGAAAAHSASRRQEPVRRRAGEFAVGLDVRNALPAAKSRVEAKSSRPIPGSDSAGGTETSLLAVAPQSTNATSQHAPTRENIATLPGVAMPDKYKSLSNRALSSESKNASATEMANAAAVPASVMAARAVSLLTPASALPAVRLSADTLSVIPAAAARRWAAEVLAGPALTYRQLGSGVNSGVLAAAPVPFSNSVGYAYDNTAANQLAREEQPSAGFGVQAQLRRALTGRWSLSAGLGYQEYASQTSYPSSATVRLQPSPASYTQRDTYRFLTAPVRLGYALGQAGGRLRFGLLAGANAAFYLGGASNGTGTAPRSWSSSGNPYRPLSLSVSAGLDLRYRVASRLEVLAQPTATYFLTSLAKAESGLTPRYLFGMGALFGLSYGLR